jgi:hypothetical protein
MATVGGDAAGEWRCSIQKCQRLAEGTVVTQSLQRREGAQRGAESVGFLMEKVTELRGQSRCGETGRPESRCCDGEVREIDQESKREEGFHSGSGRETRRSTGIGHRGWRHSGQDLPS